MTNLPPAPGYLVEFQDNPIVPEQPYTLSNANGFCSYCDTEKHAVNRSWMYWRQAMHHADIATLVAKANTYDAFFARREGESAAEHGHRVHDICAAALVDAKERGPFIVPTPAAEYVLRAAELLPDEQAGD